MVVGSDNFRHVVERLKPRFTGEIVIRRTGNTSIAAKNAGKDFSVFYQNLVTSINIYQYLDLSDLVPFIP